MEVFLVHPGKDLRNLKAKKFYICNSFDFERLKFKFCNSVSAGCCSWEPERVTFQLSSP